MTSQPTGDGGRTIGLKLTAIETEMLGSDADALMAALGRALWAAADLRMGKSRAEWWPVLTDVSQLMRQLGGVQDAALRQMPDASHAEIATSLGLSRTTVASRRQKGTLPPAEPTEWEGWVRTGTYPHEN
ncbi:AsnC family protein [Streptomyces sp. NPDC126503]|uniref:AsnC family protein n=1 Tax=Streptomyces sp. NPDC126503 TaxID=3155315 RepID=UPI00331BBDB3